MHKDSIQPVDAVSIIVRYNGEVLLVLRGNAPSRDLYAFPGGRVEAGESLEAAALRELAEETGLRAHDPQPYRIYDLVERDVQGAVTSHFMLTVFVATLDTRHGTVPQALDDAREAAWFDIDAAMTLPMPDSMHDCLSALRDAAFDGEEVDRT
jgi:8-oxo-dGTP diphosphatase